MDWNDLKQGGINVACGLLTIAVVYLSKKGSLAIRKREKAKADSRLEWTKHMASGIKGDGFSALFHLHRALHYRLRSVGWMVIGCACFIYIAIIPSAQWWLAIPWFIGLQYAVLRVTYLGAQAQEMTDVAEEAVKHHDGRSGDTAIAHKIGRGQQKGMVEK